MAIQNPVTEKRQSGAAGKAVPAGFKLTEVGVIPEDWECKYLGEFGDIVRGGSPRPAGDPRYFEGDFIPWLTVASLTAIPDAQQVVITTSSMLTELGSKHSRTLEKDTLIISNSGATLGVAKILGIKCCANDGVAAIINQRVGNKSFLVHYINTITKNLHDKVATGNGQPNLNTDLIRLIPVPFPKEKEQEKIAGTLSDCDNFILKLEKLIAKKQAIKTATMQQLLTGKTRLPQFALWDDRTAKGYKKSELGEIPEDWSIENFSTLATLRNERFNHRTKDIECFCIELEHIISEYGQLNGFTETSATSSIKNVFSPNDILFGKLRSYLKKYWKATQSGVCSTEIWVLKTELHKAIPEFIFQTVKTDRFVQTASEAYGTHMPRADWKIIKELQVATPSIEEQTAIAAILSDMDQEIQTLQQRLEKIRQLKQGMMQELLTGKTRLIEKD
ncbi:restriction endonuclease subunit S [Dickeya oryzae]|uniref:restriction endonuclease subunit S n=1 Tax=Dickeya oryzae TaxID=1240404 RepID=UPI003B968D97